MSKPLALSQRQITAICKGAEKAGHIPIIEIAGVQIRLVPEHHALKALANGTNPPSGNRGRGYL